MALGSSLSRRLIAFMAAMLIASAAAALAADPIPGASTATSLKEWLKLSDEQVAKLKPVIIERVTKMDAALDTLDAGNPPDVNRFLAERKAVKDDFQNKAKEILTPEQQKQMLELRDKIEKAFVDEAAAENLADMRILLGLTDEQVAKLEPGMVKATQSTLDLLQDVGSKGKLAQSDVDAALKTLDKIEGDLDKAITGILNPEQLAKYQMFLGEPAK